MLFSVRKLSKHFGMQCVFNDINFDMPNKQIVGLVGANGAGKTTLVNIINGDEKPDGGQITFFRKPLKIGYLRQMSTYSYQDFEKMAVEQGQQLGSYLFLTKRLGLKQVGQWQEKRYAGLSGGEKTKLALTEVWQTNPDLLILDEPTNHLDFLGVEWLVEQLKQWSGAALIISHDRYFLDQVATMIIEIDKGQTKSYQGNYSAYQATREAQRQQQLALYEKEQKMIRKIDSEIDQVGRWSQKAHYTARQTAVEAGRAKGGKEFYRSKAKKMDKHIKSRLKRLEKLKETATQAPRPDEVLGFAFQEAKQHGRRLIQATELGKYFGRRKLFEKSDFYICYGDRIGLIGPNGCGKTTLVNMLLQEENFSEGFIWMSPGVKIGYLSQDVRDLPLTESALSWLKIAHRRDADSLSLRDMLATLGLDRDMLQKPIEQLSMGERVRLKLGKLLNESYDVLILDEPTNHLDLPSREQLEKALQDYTGTLIIASHDQYLVNRVCERLLIFENQRITLRHIGMQQYLKSLKKKKRKAKHAQDPQHKLILDMKMARLVAQLNHLKPEDERYAELDQQVRALITQKQRLRD